MRVLLQIPKNAPPQLSETYTRAFREFVEACLQKNPEHVRIEDRDEFSKSLSLSRSSETHGDSIETIQVRLVDETNEISGRIDHSSSAMEEESREWIEVRQRSGFRRRRVRRTDQHEEKTSIVLFPVRRTELSVGISMGTQWNYRRMAFIPYVALKNTHRLVKQFLFSCLATGIHRT